MAISLKAEHKRFFTNPCAHEPDTVAKLCTDGWIRDSIQYVAARLTQREVSREECEEGGPYTGVAGQSWALLTAARTLPEKLQEYVDHAKRMLEMQLATSHGASKSRRTRYLTGNVGLHVVSAIMDHISGRKIDNMAKTFSSLIDIVCSDGYQRIGDDDILNGRSGFLLAVYQIKAATGVSVLTDSEIRSVISAMVTSGRLYARRNNSPAPLFYEWHKKEYLGAAHGLSGVLQTLLTYWTLLTEDEQADTKRTLDWFIGTQSPIGNWSSSMGHLHQSQGENELVHWCHGAPGVVNLLIAAILLFGEPHYVQAAKRAGELIWQRGLLLKGAGLCHGVAGNGYAHLLLYRSLKEPLYLQRARAFAVLMLEPSFEQRANVPDSPYSLFEGLAGALCFLCDVRNPARAQFPLLPVAFPE